MKLLARPFLLMSLSAICLTQSAYTQKSNIIDTITTLDQAERLVASLDEKRFQIFKLVDPPAFEGERCNTLAREANVKAWAKADFDGNGLTDLLVNGRDYHPTVVAVMAHADNRLAFKLITRRGTQQCGFAYVSAEKETPLIRFREGDRQLTLIYRFGDFFELNESPSDHTIQKIVYETSTCYGSCPSFELVLNADGTATYHAKNHNKQKGRFRGEISKQNFDRVAAALNHIEFTRLADNYSVPWTDDQQSILKITYDGGKTKTIRDYGLVGTYGLARVYDMLFSLRESEAWK
jgi:hypothetical protein